MRLPNQLRFFDISLAARYNLSETGNDACGGLILAGHPVLGGRSKMAANALSLAAMSLVALTLSVACASAPPTLLPASPAWQPVTAPTITPYPTYTPYTPFPTPTQAPTQIPIQSRVPTERTRQGYSSAFGIEYGQPEKYLAQGGQSRISNPSVVDALRRNAQSLAHLGEIYFWIQRGFKTWSAGGSTIGLVTTDQLFSERRLGGCHDWGLVYASIARELGYPAVMIDTLSITWAKQFLSGQKGSYVGHVLVEVYVGGKWVLVDSTNNWYVENDYDPTNPVIPLKGNIAGSNEENVGFYVMRKSADTWGYGIHGNNELTRMMEETARLLKPETFQYLPYAFQRFK